MFSTIVSITLFSKPSNVKLIREDDLTRWLHGNVCSTECGEREYTSLRLRSIRKNPIDPSSAPACDTWPSAETYSTKREWFKILHIQPYSYGTIILCSINLISCQEETYPGKPQLLPTAFPQRHLDVQKLPLSSRCGWPHAVSSFLVFLVFPFKTGPLLLP